MILPRGLILPQAHCCLVLWALSLCNDSPSLARLVDLHQSKRVRPGELGLQCSDRKRGAVPGFFQTPAFPHLVFALGSVLDLELHTRARRGCTALSFSLQARVWSQTGGKETADWDSNGSATYKQVTLPFQVSVSSWIK